MKEGWTYKKLGEVCEIFGRIGFRGYTKNDLVNSPEAGAITLSPSNIIDGEMNYGKCSYITWAKYEESPEIKIYPGDILLVKTASVGKTALVKYLPHKATINPQFVVLKKISINNEYLSYYLKSEKAQNFIWSIAKGAAAQTVSQKNLAEMIVPNPALSEQQRVVSRLDAAFSHIDELKANAEKQVSNARALFQKSLAKAMKPKEGWKEKKLIEITHEKCPISYGIVQQGNHIDGGVPVVRPVDMREKYITRENLKCTTQTISDSYKRTILRGDELLLSVRGTTGIISLATPELKGCNVNRGIVPLYFKDQFNKDFIYYEMVSPILQSVFAEKTTGSTLKQINIKDLRLIKLSIPPNSEQQRIVERLDAFSAHVRKLEENQKKIISECDALKQALLRKVFE